MPSPIGLPLPMNIGKGQTQGFDPKIYFQLSFSPMSYWLTYGYPYLSKFSMVVLFSSANLM